MLLTHISLAIPHGSTEMHLRGNVAKDNLHATKKSDDHLCQQIDIGQAYNASTAIKVCVVVTAINGGERHLILGIPTCPLPWRSIYPTFQSSN